MTILPRRGSAASAAPRRTTLQLNRQDGVARAQAGLRSVFNRLRVIAFPRPEKPLDRSGLFAPQFAHIESYVSSGGGVTVYNVCEFRIEA